MLRSIEEGGAEEAEPQPIPDAAPHPLLHPYHAYASPRSPSPSGTTDDGNDEGIEEKEEEESKPLRQLRAYLQRQDALAARPWWRLRSASYLLLVLVGVSYLGGRSLILRSVVYLWVRPESDGVDPT